MKYTNINIDSPKGQMKYYIEYIEGNKKIDKDIVYLMKDDSYIYFYDSYNDVLRSGNEWSVSTKDGNFNTIVCDFTTLPGTFGNVGEIPAHRISYLNIYFPRFSVETYKSGVRYALNVSIYINNTEVMIGSYLINRNDAIAVDNIKKFSNEEYYEYVRVPIINPWDILYSDEWKEFRIEACNEPLDEGFEINATGSLVNISLHPVELTSTNTYTEIDDYKGGQNSINISDEVTDYLKFEISDNRNENGYYENRMLISTSLSFNQAYTQDMDGLKEYMRETYRLEDFSLKMEISIQDENDIYKYMLVDVDEPWKDFDIREKINDSYPFLFDSWDGYTEGIYINIILHIVPKDQDTLIYLKSNKIALTPELFRYLVGSPDDANRIFLEAVDMNVFNINAVNKVSQTVIQMERPDDYKANLIKPVFFRTQDLGSIVVHPEVTENICINLDSYKSKVDSFVLKLEGVLFNEYGRNNSGVLFKITGSSLPGSVSSGIYYILNQDNELITTGKYKYES